MMQQDWGRRHDFVALEAEDLSAMLQPVFPGRQLLSAELLTAGGCNTNYKIRVSGLADAFVLRIYVREKQAIHKDWHIFKLVSERVPVAEILYTTGGSTPDEARRGRGEPRPYSVMKWVDGVLLSDILATQDSTIIAECAHDVGVTLANIGTYTFPQAGFFAPDLTIAEPFGNDNTVFLAYMEQFLFKGRTGQRLGPELTERLWKLVTNNTTYLAAPDGVASLVHSDFKGFNILVHQQRGHWRVSAVLDWEFAFAGSPLNDIGNMLRYDRLHPPTFETQFIRGYQEQGGQLPPGWKRSAKLADLLSLCELLNAPDRGKSNALVEEVTGLIVGTIENWEEYPA